MTGRILVWDPPHVLEHEWNQPIVEAGVVRYELHPDGDGHDCCGSPTAVSACRNATGFLAGTQAFLDRLEAHLAGDATARTGPSATAKSPVLRSTDR